MSQVIKARSGPKGLPYQAKFTIGSGSDRIRLSKRFASKKEAQFWLNQKELMYPDKFSAVRGKLTFSEYYKFWVESEKTGVLEPATVLTYWVTLKHFKPLLGDQIFTHISRIQVQKSFNQLEKTLSHATLSKDLSHLKSLYETAMANGDVTLNPCVGIHFDGSTDRLKTPAKKFMPETELITLQHYLLCKRYAFRDVNIFALFIVSQTALRIGEALALTKDDIDPERLIIHVDQSFDSSYGSGRLKAPKTSTSLRDVPITKVVMDKITWWCKIHKEWLKEAGIPNPKGLIFLNKRGVLPIARNVNSSFKQLQKKLGLPGLYTVHSFRSTIASLMLANQIPEPYIGRYLGHKLGSGITRKYYLDELPDHIEEDQDAVRRVLEGAMYEKN